MRSLSCSLIILGMLLPGPSAALVEYDPGISQLEFAAQALGGAMKEAGKEDLAVSISISPDESNPEAFRIRTHGARQVEVIGTDANGAMYGGLEVADRLRLGLPIKDQEQAPFIKKRGIKFNIPLDARTPSYDDTGDAAQKNVETVWDYEFWTEYIDHLARYRYNVLSLWSTQPYANFVKLEEYPEAIVEDVYRVKEGLIKPHHPRDLFKSFDTDGDLAIEPEDGTIELVKRMTIDEKIAYWQKVFDYAESRGMDIYLFSWNVFTHGATGKYGITQEQDNPLTIEYMRRSVRQTLINYPQISGIGVTAGENSDRTRTDEWSKENYVFNAFGRGIMDVLEQQPDRRVRFIVRRHNAERPLIDEAFADYPDEVDTSTKYAVAHMYSSRRPQEWELRIIEDGWIANYKVWLNLRNDDIFVHRWGGPEYVRDFINWMPHDHIRGFYMGSDGYVWARNFTAKNPEMAGRLEIDKHWYNFRLWGQLAYNNELGRDYWEATLRHRFPGVDAGQLYDAWAAVSEIVPQVIRTTWSPTDASISAEGCIQLNGGFLTVDDLYFDREPMPLTRIDPAPDPQVISASAWAQSVLTGEELPGITLLQAADNLDEWAAKGLETLPALRRTAGDNTELKETLNDIESMAYLGRYYADKMRGAAKLAVFRADSTRKQYHEQAVAHLEDAVEHWKAYAAVITPQYETQLLARTQYLDWYRILEDVEKEVVTVRNEADVPELQFANLKDGARFPAGTDLRIELKASDKHGVRDFRLFLNGLRLDAHGGAAGVWSDSSDDLLKDMKPGRYHLEAVATDNTSVSTRREIQITVGDVPKLDRDDWKEQVHQVVLKDGELLFEGDFRHFPRLETYVLLDDDGKLGIYNGAPGDGVLMWGTRGKDDRPGTYKQFAVFRDGQFLIYRGTPDDPIVKIWETPRPIGPGPYQLGITVSKRLAIYRDKNGKTELVWSSPDVG